MGFSVAASSAILFSSFIFFTIIIFGAFFDGFQALEDNTEEETEFFQDQIDTDLSIIHSQYNATSNVMMLFVENTGDRVIDLSDLDLLINGEMVSANILTTTINGVDTDVWLPQDTMVMTVDDPDLEFKSTFSTRLYDNYGSQMNDPQAVSIGDRCAVIDADADGLHNTLDIYDLNYSFQSSVQIGAASIFYDGFEGGNFNQWDSPVGSEWEVTTAAPKVGNEHARVDDTDGQSSQRYLTASVSTASYSNIAVSYQRCSNNFESNDFVYIEWYDGLTWHTLETFTDGSLGDNSNTLVEMSFNLPDSANDNAYFQLRFDGDMNSGNDDFDLDEVLIQGIPEISDTACTDYVYITSGLGEVVRFSLTGTGETTLISISPDLVEGSALHATAPESGTPYIYIIDENDHLDRFELDGTFDSKLIPSGQMDDPIQLYVRDYIYVINEGGGSPTIDRYDLDGSSRTELIADTDPELTNPIDLAVSDNDFTDDYLYILDDSDSDGRGDHIDVFWLNGTHVTTLTEHVSTMMYGIEANDRLVVADGGAEQLVVLNIGSVIKLVTGLGLSGTLLI